MKFRLFRPLLRVWRSTTHQEGAIGRSLAFGMVIGFSPTVGAQVVVALVLGLIWNRVLVNKVNLPIAIVGTAVVNPITMAPTYLLYYQLACSVITCETALTAQTFASLSAITDLGTDIIVAVCVGSVPFMIAGLPLGLWLGRRIETFLQRRKRRREQKAVARSRVGDTAPSPGRRSAF